MCKVFNLRPVQTRSSVSRSSGTCMKMLAPFGLKYYRPLACSSPRNLCIMRGEIDYVASNRSIDPRGVRSTPPMERLISALEDDRHWTRPDAPFLGPTSAEVATRTRQVRFAPMSVHRQLGHTCPIMGWTGCFPPRGDSLQGLHHSTRRSICGLGPLAAAASGSILGRWLSAPQI
jgi:hypothetical protein